MQSSYSFFHKYISTDESLRKQWGQALYFFSLALIVTTSLLEFSTFNEYISMHSLNRLTYVPIGIVLCKVFIIDGLNWQILLQNVFLLGLSILSMKLASSSLIVTLVVFVIGARNISFNKILKVYYTVASITLLIIMIAAFAGIIANFTFYRGNIIRHSFGILYPTDFASHVLSIILAYYCVNYRKLTWVEYIVTIVISYLLYYFCNSRLTCLTLIIMIFVFLLAKQASLGNRNARVFLSFCWGGIPVLCYLEVSLSYIYTNSNYLLVKINHALSNRLSLGRRAIQKYGISLFGQNVQERGWGKGIHAATSTSNYFFIDSSYLRFLIIYGVIIGLIVLYWMIKISIDSFRIQEYGICAAILIVAISAFVEQHLFEVSYNPFILAYFSLIGTPNIYKKKKVS